MYCPDAVDQDILNIIQASFPIEARPYLLLARKTGITEEEAFQRVENLRKKGIIRRIGGVFDSRSLGYTSTLCAAKVPPHKIGLLAELSRDIPEITHNYLRDHQYNMWFTVIASSQERLKQIIAQVKLALGSDEVYSLPALKIFKIGVILQFKREEALRIEQANIIDGKRQENKAAEKGGRQDLNTNHEKHISEQDKELIRQLQGDLPYSGRPFSELANALLLSEQEMLTAIRQLQAKGYLRRVGAILYHQKAGFTSNAMGVWIVPREDVEKAGSLMAEFKEVSHCYERPTLPDWPYNLFTMIHGQSDEECRQIMSRISQAVGVKDYTLLFSVAELKKSSMRYFSE